MEILAKPKCTRQLKKLPGTIQEMAFEKSAIFCQDPFDPRLKTHKLHGKIEGYWALSIDHRTRAIFEFLDKNTAIFHSIGTHDIYG